MPLTPSQQLALTTDRHLAIMANAGSGKTRVLVHRYVDLFERYPQLTSRNVAAITFTENAAGELRERIAKEIKERLDTTKDSMRRARLSELRESLRNGFIGTIHSFAMRILKEYPIEAAVDASFAILSEADARIFQEDAIQRTFYSVLEEAYTQDEENSILFLFRALGRSHVRNLVRGLFRNRQRALTIQTNLLTKDDDDIIRFWQQRIENEIIPTLKEGLLAIREIEPYLARGNDGVALNEAIQQYRNAAGSFSQCVALTILLERLLTTTGIRKRAVNTEEIPAAVLEQIEYWLADIKSKRQLISSIPPSQEEFDLIHKNYLHFIRSTFNLYSIVRTEYDSSKAEYGSLDFDDLIEKLLHLLDNPQTRAELSKEFRFIMIDEYQDTDESQFEIAKRLTENFAAINNLAIVGDPKQSIYTFRNADAEIFHMTRRHIGAAVFPSSSSDTGHIELAESFRMARAPLAAINRLFRTLLKDPEHPYSELIHAREDEEVGTAEWICPSVETDEDNSEGAENNDELETELIALRIYSLIEQGVNPEDIAILLRSRTHLSELERTLSKVGIPYSVAKGSGFFEQQEILDITSYLSFLISPENDMALASILRSPFFGLSDVELFKIAHHSASIRNSNTTGQSFWKQFQEYVQFTVHPYLRQVLSQLQENISLTGRTSTVLLIEKIFGETGIFATLGASERPEQKIANLKKFLALARASDQSGFSGIFDFVERIRYLRESGEQESQAEIPADSGAVRIMTVHAAKGLEFPVVILPFLQRSFHASNRGVLDKELGLEISGENSNAPIAELILERAARTEYEEEKRILYVAMTRAKDHLILSSTIPKTIPKKSWLAWITDAIGIPTNGAISLSENIVHYDSESMEKIIEPFELSIPTFRSEADIPLTFHAKASLQEPLEEIFIPEGLQSHIATGRFSASEFIRLKDCPTKYYLSYILGIPEDALLQEHPIGERPENYSGRIVGQIVHHLAEQLEHIAPSGVLVEELFQEDVFSILDELRVTSSHRNELVDTARMHIARFLESPISAELRNAGNPLAEFSIQTRLESGDTLHGVLDRLYFDSQKGWTVLDFKTDSVPNPDRHAFQLEFYAYLVHRMTKAETIRGILFFTTTGESKDFLFSNFSSFEQHIVSRIEFIRTIQNTSDLQLLPRNEVHCSSCRYFVNSSQKCIVLARQNPIEIPAI